MKPAAPGLGLGLTPRVVETLRARPMTTREIAEALGVHETQPQGRATVGQNAVAKVVSGLRKRGVIRVVTHVDEPVGGPKRHVRHRCKRVYGLVHSPRASTIGGQEARA